MTDPREPPHTSAAPAPLDYRRPHRTRTRPSTTAPVIQFIVGFFAAALVAVAFIPATGPGAMDDALRLALKKLTPVILAFGVLIVLLHVKLRWHGFTAGALIGLALGALCIGTCAVIAE